MKKLIALVLVVVMALGVFAACTPKAPVDTDPKPVDTTPVDTTPVDTTPVDTTPVDTTPVDPYAEHITFTIAAIDGAALGIQNDGTESAVWTYLKEKFNFEFSEVWPLDWGNYIDQTRIWINTDSAPDIMMLDVAAPRYAEFVEWVNADKFAPYSNLENYPNLSARLEMMTTGKNFIVNDELYAWPAYLDTASSGYAQVIGYIYRADWAKSVNLYQEDNHYTWEEWWALCDAIKAADPAGNGETIPVQINSDYALPSRFTLSIAPNIHKFVWDAANSTWVWGATLPETKTAAEFVKEKYDAGIIWKDQMLDFGAAGDNFAAGKLFANLTDGIATGSFVGNKATFEDANPDLVYEDVFDYAVVDGPDGKLYTVAGSDQWSQTAMNVNMTQAQIDRWMAILDYLASDEGYFVRNAGIPGTDWELDENGDLVILWPEDENGNQVMPYQGTWPWARIAGCNDNFSNYSPDQPAKVQEMILDLYDLILNEATFVWTDKRVDWFQDEAYGTATAGLEVATWQKFQELLIQDDFVDQFTAWVAEKNVELAPAIEALNAAFPNG